MGWQLAPQAELCLEALTSVLRPASGGHAAWREAPSCLHADGDAKTEYAPEFAKPRPSPDGEGALSLARAPVRLPLG